MVFFLLIIYTIKYVCFIDNVLDYNYSLNMGAGGQGGWIIKVCLTSPQLCHGYLNDNNLNNLMQSHT